MTSSKLNCFSKLLRSAIHLGIHCLFCSTIFGQIAFYKQRQSSAVNGEALLQDSALTSVCFINEHTGWAVGRYGVILHTQDGGLTWSFQDSGTQVSLHGVTFLDELTGWAVGGELTAAAPGGRGVLLHTHDGGQTWKKQPTLLPALRNVQFFDQKHGIVVGCGSEDSPRGVFLSIDGGQSWRKQGGGARQTVLAADYQDLANGIVAGTAGHAARTAGGLVEEFQQLDVAGRTIRDVVLQSSTDAWIVGERGLALQTQDLGQSWQAAESLAEIAGDHPDLLSICTFESHVWVAGAPGTFVLHSADGGRTWQLQATGIRTPINKIHFVDAQHGWAVGDMGVIISTADGGQTWKTQRGRQRSAAVLTIASSARDLPMEVLGSLAAEEGYRTVIFIVADVELSLPGSRIDLVTRLESAAEILGLSSASLSTRFQSPSTKLQLDVQTLRAEFERRHDDLAKDTMIAEIVRQIRTWQPAVLIIPADVDAATPLNRLVGAVAIEAVRQAAEPTLHVDLTTGWNLPPWNASKIFASLPTGSLGTHHINTDTTGRRTGAVLTDLVSPARALLHAPGSTEETVAEFRLLSGSHREKNNDLMAGLAIQPGSSKRRPWVPVAADSSNVRHQVKLAERRRNLRRILHSDKSAAENWVGQIIGLTDDLDINAATGLLSELATELRTDGQVSLAADVLQLLVKRYPEHIRAEEAISWLIRFFASDETAHVYASNLESQHYDRAATRGIKNASFEAEAESQAWSLSSGFSERFTRDERLTRSTEYMAYLAQRRPDLHNLHSLRYPWAIAQRKRGFIGTAEKYFISLRHRHPDDPWQICADTEGWLAEPGDHTPKKLIANNSAAIVRPRLDGRLEDECWQRSRPIKLTTWESLVELGQCEIWFAHDREFLYVAVRCEKAPGSNYPTGNPPRRFDSDIAPFDHVRLLLDIDRDYTSWFELAFDCRGSTEDKCWGDVFWNPTWYVAADQDEESWTIEAAIPFSQLTHLPPQSRHVWAVAAERVAPSVGLQTWNGPPLTEQPIPNSFGVMIFD